MVLLTSSQVSVLISSAIVVSCTAALFLSGYVIQQRTLSQLREAIKPESRPSPKASYYVPEHLKDAAGNKQNVPLYGANGKQEQIIIEVNPTVPEKQQQKQQQQQQTKKQKAGQKSAGWTSDMWQKMTGPPEKEDKGGVSREDLEKMNERERNINGWNVKDQANPDPEASNQKPISRAERRRLIKEELRRLSESEERVYYQRRLW
ncbi:hypothetical protein BDP55DRAFT_11876 [Colletotrichum godetiae]|uniref:Uncharacterized protein n=1 Tax=Colletotrichum godetiae TaxID=1209918 RepID=A0AAJ0B174_9PEZI|nr:uncharacterized protein BDP55DRAFT_11876 [Colletotrichum godetiae]KAK1701197.1 hypothetical protein BDP55DRAFT_11876 [Colletotrichum godetiae]